MRTAFAREKLSVQIPGAIDKAGADSYSHGKDMHWVPDRWWRLASFWGSELGGAVGEREERLIDVEELRRRHEARRLEIARDPSQRLHVQRAKVRVLHNYLKEARVGSWTFLSDESTEIGGGGTAPNPLAYFVAAVGF